MRRILALSALLAIAACWTGCAADNSKTTNSAAANSAPANSSAAPMNTNPSVSNTSASQAPKTVGGSAPPSGIKPPMKDEKKK